MIINLIDNPDSFRAPRLDEDYPMDVTTSFIRDKSTASASFNIVFEKEKDNERLSKYAYQWYKDENAIAGANEPSLELTDIDEVCVHDIFCRVANRAGRESDSNHAVLTVNEYYLPVLDDNYPADVDTVFTGDGEITSTFEVVISEHGNPANEYLYRWYVDGELQPETGSTFQILCSECTEVITKSVYCEVYLADNDSACVKSKVATYTIRPAIYLFNNGDITNVTGGWTFGTTSSYSRGTYSVDEVLYLKATRPADSSVMYGVYLSTNNVVDVSNYTKLHIVWGPCSSNSDALDSIVRPTYRIYNGDNAFYKSASVTSGNTPVPSDGEESIWALDEIVASDMKLHLKFYAETNWAGTDSVHMTLRVRQIWLE